MRIKTLLHYTGWASGIFGGILILGGIVGYFVGGEFLHVRNYYNWFYISNTFIFFGIFALLGSHCCNCCKGGDVGKQE